jgi:hypothetical protein
MDALRVSDGCRDGGEGVAGKRLDGEYLYLGLRQAFHREINYLFIFDINI